MSSSTSSFEADHAARRFLLRAAASFVSTLLIVGAVNVVVDPYRVFRLVDAVGFNARKPRAMEQGYLSKLAGVAATRPERLIVGNSRAEVGLNPKSPAWGDSLVTYSAALPGFGPETALAFMRDARAQGRLQQVIVGLDFLDFLVGSTAEVAASRNPMPMVADPRKPSGGTPALDLRVRLGVIFSLDAFLDSAYTVAVQRADGKPDLTQLGFNPMRDYAKMVTRDGYGAFFLQRDQENARMYLRDPKSVFEPGGRTSATWQVVDTMVDLCHGLPRGCTFLIYPYHAHILELFELTGLSTAFLEWKGELVHRLGSHGQPTTDTRGPIVLWDFSGYSR